MATIVLSADSQATALLCSSLALPQDTRLKPLTTREWNLLATQITESTVDGPGDLIGKTESEVANALNAPGELAHRVASLLARAGQLAFELEWLFGRGLWLATRSDEEYPALWKARLGIKAPPVVFGAGTTSLLNIPAIAVVGSRDASDSALDFAAALARRCAREGLSVCSGAARGVDITAMMSAVDTGGAAVGVLAESLEKSAQSPQLREPLIEGSLALITPFHPSARFNVGHAMRRNSLIYALSRAAVVVASTRGGGGTTAGAVENLKAGWVALYARDDGSDGNRDLIQKGARPLPDTVITEEQPLPFEKFEDDASSIPVESQLMNLAASEETSEQAPEAEEDSEASTELVDLFTLAWPHIAGFLSEERAEREVADNFGLELSQARSWLKRAVDEGLAERLGSRRRYVIGQNQSPLFGDGDP